ncbi:MAG: hypothetical protein C0402_13960 [Thermodesulfovibrio sp.]|nr:hypothetical protein [Thermodesulfovibrio sp.]
MMKCPHMVSFLVCSCKAGTRPYVPSLFELDEYCRTPRHSRCPFYLGTQPMQGSEQQTEPYKGRTIKNIMIVDDEETIRQLISLILRTEGHTVVEAVHGRDALDKVTGETIDMVITDLRMPQMDGIMLTRELRSRPYTFSIPIVMLTTGFDGYKKNEADRAGVNERIKKPLIHQQLVETVRRYAV